MGPFLGPNLSSSVTSSPSNFQEGSQARSFSSDPKKGSNRKRLRPRPRRLLLHSSRNHSAEGLVSGAGVLSRTTHASARLMTAGRMPFQVSAMSSANGASEMCKLS